jgi:hypothetical protein
MNSMLSHGHEDMLVWSLYSLQHGLTVAWVDCSMGWGFNITHYRTPSTFPRLVVKRCGIPTKLWARYGAMDKSAFP